MGTAIKSPSCLGFSYNQIMTAERAGDANFFVIRFRVAAFRKSRAGKELSMTPCFYDHHTAALLTLYITYNDFLRFYRNFTVGNFQFLFKGPIELLEDIFLFSLVLTDGIQFISI